MPGDRGGNDVGECGSDIWVVQVQLRPDAFYTGRGRDGRPYHGSWLECTECEWSAQVAGYIYGRDGTVGLCDHDGLDRVGRVAAGVQFDGADVDGGLEWI